MDLLAQECARLGLELPLEAPEQFARYAGELLEWNQRVNLTAITQPEEIVLKHFVDSLTGLLALPPAPKTGPDIALVDIGAGGGFPGLALKLGRPAIRLTLVESVAKKTVFLRHMVGVLGLQDVTVVTARAEDLGRITALREHFDVAASRAVAALPALLELMLPLVRTGGIALAWKRDGIADELRSSTRALDLLGGQLRQQQAFRLAGDGRDRLILVFEKVRNCPPAYPRRPGVPGKHPL